MGSCVLPRNRILPTDRIKGEDGDVTNGQNHVVLLAGVHALDAPCAMGMHTNTLEEAREFDSSRDDLHQQPKTRHQTYR